MLSLQVYCQTEESLCQPRLPRCWRGAPALLERCSCWLLELQVGLLAEGRPLGPEVRVARSPLHTRRSQLWFWPQRNVARAVVLDLSPGVEVGWPSLSTPQSLRVREQ